MNWYVKSSETGKISGPVDQKAALAMAEQSDGMAFSEQIFSPKFVASEAVESLLAEMRSVATAEIVIPLAQELLKRAIDTITLLCREKPTVALREVEALLHELKGLRTLMNKFFRRNLDIGDIGGISQEVDELLHELRGLRTSMEIVRNGEDDAIGLLCGRIANALISQERVSKDIEEGSGAETDGIIRELRALEGDVVLRGPDRQTCKKAANALSQLQAVEATSPAIKVQAKYDGWRCSVDIKDYDPTTKGCLTFLRKEKQKADTMDCCGDDYLHASNRLLSKVCQRAIDALIHLSREKKVTGTIEGGVLALDDLPEGVTVDILDYDVPSYSVPALIAGKDVERDDSGRACSRLHWGV